MQSRHIVNLDALIDGHSTHGHKRALGPEKPVFGRHLLMSTDVDEIWQESVVARNTLVGAI